MCCSFHEEAGGEILNDYYLKYLTSGHPSLRSLTFVHARRDRFSSSEPLNVHFSIGIGYSHVKERNFLPLCTRYMYSALPYTLVILIIVITTVISIPPQMFAVALSAIDRPH